LKIELDALKSELKQQKQRNQELEHDLAREKKANAQVIQFFSLTF